LALMVMDGRLSAAATLSMDGKSFASQIIAPTRAMTLQIAVTASHLPTLRETLRKNDRFPLADRRPLPRVDGVRALPRADEAAPAVDARGLAGAPTESPDERLPPEEAETLGFGARRAAGFAPPWAVLLRSGPRRCAMPLHLLNRTLSSRPADTRLRDVHDSVRIPAKAPEIKKKRAAMKISD
jgi:hypothetical protein